MEILFCRSCDASNRRESRFCAECGAALAGESPEESGAPDGSSRVPEPRGRSTRTRRPAGRKRSARHQIKSAAYAIARVRLFFFALGILAALVFVVLVLGLSQMSPGEISQGTAAFMLALVGVPMAVCFLGAWLAQRHPLPWALALAGLLTLNVVTTGGGLLSLLLMFASWGFLVPVLRLQKLMRENPDDQSIAGLRAGRSGRRGRLRGSLIGDFATAGMLLVGFLIVLFGGLYGVGVVRAITAETREDILNDQPDEPLEPILARFEDAWRDADFAAMGALYHPRLRSRRAGRLERRLQQRNLSAPLPTLSNPRVVNYGRMQQMATWRSSMGVIEVVFEYSDDEWSMIALRFP